MAPKQLDEFPVVFTAPVQWGDQDCYGHVNNILYFRWFESARMLYFDRLNLTQRDPQNPIGPILAAISCNFRKQLSYPDTFHVGIRVTRIGRSSMQMENRLFSESQDDFAADGDSTIVLFHYGENKSHPISEELRGKIEQIEGKSF